jgi:eukaryotic-like serine/threonine-protein kinase
VDAIEIGAFTLQEPIGQGGMGEVWRTVHRRTGMTVAVKVLTEKACRRPGYFDRFRAEVRAVAGLRHEGVVQLYEYGQIPDEAEAASDGRLAAGSPYLAMEWLDGGSLREVSVSWGELRAIALQVLDALAHAHAREVVHRDVKPANIMIAHRGGRAKLVDFGIAIGPEDEEAAADEPAMLAGTPAYMAPEQCTGDRRLQGPWTDLYALGCTLWALTTGAPPHLGDEPLQTLMRHVNEPLPPFVAQIGVPPGFPGWLKRLLAKLPRDRYRHAADAALGLLSLEAFDSGQTSERLPRLETLDLLTVMLETHQSGGTDVMVAPAPLVEHAKAEPSVPRKLPVRAPPVPITWRVTGDGTKLGLTDAGVGLFRMRTIPFVGRERERDQIWSDLVRVEAGDGPRAVHILGAAGSGKTRLGEWLVQRAQELGAANVLRARLHAGGEARHGLLGMLRAYLRTRGLALQELVAQLRSDGLVAEEDVESLARMLVGGNVTLPPTTPTERHAMIARVLERLSAERPVVLLLDDLHNRPEVADFVQHLVGSGMYERCAVLVLVTLSSESLAQVPELAAARDDRHRSVELDSFSREEYRMLLSEMLRLTPHAVGVLEERTSGNPLYTVELVGSWVEQGVLVPSDDGYDFLDRGPTVVPDLAAVWSARVREAFMATRDAERHSIMLAAVLGQSVDAARWRYACERVGMEASWRLVDRLVAAGMARVDERVMGWSFVHAMVRENLVEECATLGLAAGFHAAAADALAGSDDGEDTLRRAMHLEHAGLTQGLEPLLFRALRWGVDRSDVALAARAKRMLDQLASEGALSRSAKCDLALEAARLAHHGDDPEVQLVQALEAQRLAVGLGDAGRQAAAALQCGRARLQLNRMNDSLADLEQAEKLARDAGNLALVGEALRSQAETLAQLGRNEPALEAALRAGAFNEGHGRPDHAGAAYVKAAMCASILGRTDEAVDLLVAAEPLLEAGGAARGIALLENQRGEILRKRGELDAAADAYRRAIARRRRLGLTSRGVEEANLALILQASGHHARAKASLQAALPEIRRKRQRLVLCAVRAVMLCSVAALGEWHEVDELVAAVRDDLQTYREPDVAASLEAAARFALDAGEHARAAPLLELAIAQHDGLGQVERAQACREHLALIQRE